MKKLFLTMAVIFSTLIASAQFMVVTTVNQPADSAEWGMDNFTDNLGIGYYVNDRCVVGVVKNGDDYDLFGRYLVNENVYASVQAPTEEMLANLTVGLGYSFNLWKGVCVEPNYTMGLKEDDDGEREGKFNIGLSYRF
jgi:opacity protein-like surface antigen